MEHRSGQQVVLSLILGIRRQKKLLPNLLSCYSRSCSFRCCILLSFKHAKDGQVTISLRELCFRLGTSVHMFGSSSPCLEGATFVSSGRVYSRLSKVLENDTDINQKEEYWLSWSFWRFSACDDYLCLRPRNFP